MKISVIALVMCAMMVVTTTAEPQSYRVSDNVPVLVNKIGPYSNPMETYRYYSLPFCRPDNPEKMDETMGEVLVGDRFEKSAYEVQFRSMCCDRDVQVV